MGWAEVKGRKSRHIRYKNWQESGEMYVHSKMKSQNIPQISTNPSLSLYRWSSYHVDVCVCGGIH